MNLRRLNPKIHICAELSFDQNIDHFVACGCDTLISPDVLTARAAVLATVSPLLIDFIFDVLTYHEHDEFIAESVANVEALTGEVFVGQRAFDAHQLLIRRGANLIGLVQGRRRERGLFQADFSDLRRMADDGPRAEGYFLPLTTFEGRSTILRPEHVLIFSAKSRQSIRSERNVRALDEAPEITAEDIHIRREKPSRVLVVAEPGYAAEIESSLEALNGRVETDVVDPGSLDSQLLTLKRLEGLVTPGVVYSHVIFLNERSQRNACVSDLDMNEFDATSILNTRLVRSFFDERQPEKRVSITVEALNISNRMMFKDAGADAVVCSLTLVERFLTKEIYEKSQILDYVVALLNVTDRVHLYSFRVQENDRICGMPYASILKSKIEGFRLIGWLPVSQRDVLKNHQGDFDFHFRTVIGKRIVQTNVQPGDELVVVLDRRESDWLTRDDIDINLRVLE